MRRGHAEIFTDVGYDATGRELRDTIVRLEKEMKKEKNVKEFAYPLGTTDREWNRANGCIATDWFKGETLPQFMAGIPHIAVPDEMIENIFKPTKIIFSGNATICFWGDGEKTVVRTSEDEPFIKEFGVAMCIVKHLYGSREKFLNAVRKGQDSAEEEKKKLEEKGK